MSSVILCQYRKEMDAGQSNHVFLGYYSPHSSTTVSLGYAITESLQVRLPASKSGKQKKQN